MAFRAEQRHTATDIIRLILSEMIKSRRWQPNPMPAGCREPSADTQDDAPTGEDSSQ